MKKFLFLPLFVLLTLPAFSQTGFEMGVQVGTNFSRLHTFPFCGFGETGANSINLRPSGFNAGLKGAWNFHPNFAIEMSASLNRRWVSDWDQSAYTILPVFRCFPSDTYLPGPTRQLDLEYQTRIRYKMLAGRRVQPWISTGITQFARLHNPVQDRIMVAQEANADYAAQILPGPGGFDQHKYDIALVHAVGVRIKLNQLVSVDMETSLRHFALGGSGYRNNLMPSTNVGVVFTPGN